MAKGYVTIPVGYKRTDNLPLLDDQVFQSKSAADEFAAGPTAYVGQILAVNEAEVVTAYIIKNDKSLSEIGSKSITSYTDLTNKPQIGGVELTGNKSLAELGIQAAGDYATIGELPTKVSDLENDSKFQTDTQVSSAISSAIGALGSLFVLKGRKDTFEELESVLNANPGDVWLVGTSEAPELEEYVYTTESKWEKLGITTKVDLSEYYKKTEADEKFAAKADGITSEERTKLSKIKTDGEGNKILTDAGTYINVPNPETGVSDYGDLTGKPTLNGVEIDGAQTSEDLKIDTTTTKVGDINPDGDGITVQLGSGGTVGGFKTGDKVTEDMTIADILKKLLMKQVPPTYSKPTATLTGNGTVTVECGTKQTLTINANYNKNDGGEVTSYTLKRGAETLINAEGSIRSYEDTDVVIPEGTLTYTATIAYAQGPIKNDNLGQPYPTGQIQAGQLTPSKTYTGQRKMFWSSNTNDIPVTSSAEVRALDGSKLNPTRGSSQAIVTEQGCTCIAFAYPASLGEVTTIMQKSTNLDVKGSFVKTEVSVEGAEEYSAVNYYVYKYTAAIGMNADTFTVTI